MVEAGCRSAFLGYKKFPGQICISLNDEVVHGIGGSRRIQYGDAVKLDIGVILDGFVGDTAATVPVGIVHEDVRRLLEVAENALYLGIEKRSEEHTSELQSHSDLVCRLLLEKKKQSSRATDIT